MPTTSALIAQAAPAPAAGDPAAQATPFFMNPIFVIGMFALLYVVVLLPATRRQKREAAAQLAGIKAGSKVQLGGGILGTVVRVKDGEDEIVVKSEDSKFRVLRSSVVRVMADETPAETK